MKRVLLTVLSVLSAFLVMSEANAGTVMVGAKAWYVEWDSAYDKANADVMVDIFEAFYGGNWSATVKPGTGYLAGPLIGYQTDDNQWSFSAAFMILNSFKTNTEWEVDGTKVNTETKLDRKDIDVSASYMLSGNMKMFVGFKYVIANYDLTVEGDDWYTAKMISKIPTAGISLVFPLSESLVLGIQLGAMYIIPTLEEKYDTGTVEYKMDKSFGGTVEPAITYTATEYLMLQLGARYQIYSVKFKDWDVTKNDRLLGVTASVVYLW